MAHVLLNLCTMNMSKRQSERNVTETLSCVLRWVLRKGGSAMSCEINMTPDRAFHLRVASSREPGTVQVQYFTNPLAVMARHAEVARGLREAGWVVTERHAMPVSAAA